ncbi:MAG TPA: glutamine synthetase family protein [Terriglobia bacterium]|nr:glutamine synthetase family protein [Terriglobia bacterium]
MDLKQIEALLAEHSITKIKVGGFDVDGILRGKYISRDKFNSAAETGFGFCDVIFGWDSSDQLYDNVKVTGWHTGYPDALARIDLSTFRVIPWEPATAFFILDFYDNASQPLAVSPRQVLQCVIARAERLGFHPQVSTEYEFFIFQENSHSVREKHYRDMKPLSPGMFGYSVLRTGVYSELAHGILDAMRAFDVELEGFHTETGPGVYETAIKHDSALRAADKAALFKTGVKQIAARSGLIATFMAKWNAALPGCSGHLHESLWNANRAKNLFHDSAAPDKMSKLMRQYLAGQLQLMPEMTALVCPTVNSYKRLVPGVWAPTNATWGVDNRTAALRAVLGPSGKSVRVEYRLAGADINPYLAIAASLASGLYGIEHQLDLPPACGANAYESSAPLLPKTLESATALLEQSRAARELLGDEFVDHYVRTREWEVRQYERAVTDWELERYFEII